PRDRGTCGTTRRRIQLRKHDVANSVPRVGEVVVRFVLDPAFPASREIAAKVCARNVEQRANHAAAPWMNAREAGQSRAANQLEKERFCLVVLRVAYRDPL